MAAEIKVPNLGESITEATVSKWLKRPGDAVAVDEPVAELETDKVTLEVPAPAGGRLSEILAEEGANVPVGAVLGRIAEGAEAAPHPPATPVFSSRPLAPTPPSPAGGAGSERGQGEDRGEGRTALERSGPAVRKLIEESGLDVGAIAATGPGGRITKADALAAKPPAPPPQPPSVGEREVRVPMTRLRRRIAERLKAAQNAAAMLTTFNEIDMSEVIALRERHRDAFEKKHGFRLGFRSARCS